MPGGSFLSNPIHSVPDLLKQFDSDAGLRARYSRLFHMSPEMVRMAFASLHKTTMPDTRLVEIWYVHSGERIGYKVRRVRKGTTIFAMPDGIPALAQVCGNPMRNILPSARLKAKPAPQTNSPSTVIEFDDSGDIPSIERSLPSLSMRPPQSALPDDFIESPEPLPPTSQLPETPSAQPEALPPIATHQLTLRNRAV